MYSGYTKSSPIKVPKPNNVDTTISLKENSSLFDPSKSSPPNEFMHKLQERINNYSPKSLENYK